MSALMKRLLLLPNLFIIGACFALAFCAEARETSWAAYNHTITLRTGVMQQDYTEKDPFGLTNNGILNTERGTPNQLQLAARWQSESLPLALQATLGRSNGGTHYHGYLQTGILLTPYTDITGNIMTDIALRAGFPILYSEKAQWIPFIEFQTHQWERRLAQYTENFNHTAGLLGVLLQYRPAGLWSFEAEGAAGQLITADMNAPTLGFNQSLGKRGIWQFSTTMRYEFSPRWHIHTQLTTRRFSYGQSAIQGGLLIPDSDTQQSSIGVGIDWHY